MSHTNVASDVLEQWQLDRPDGEICTNLTLSLVNVFRLYTITTAQYGDEKNKHMTSALMI